MSGWTTAARKWRDRIKEDYLQETGREKFVPTQFIAWLADKPRHPAHDLFYTNQAPISEADWEEGARVRAELRHQERLRLGAR
jgi:hypothetical protein